MARIRSLHPGQAVDENFVEMSFAARLFALHLRCEADDHGIFEWKPKRLKMAIFPADDVDIDAVLEELVANQQAKRFEVEGRSYGAVRNFCRWQSPKKPNYTHPLPSSLRNYVGLNGDELPTDETSSDESSELVGNQFGTGTEKLRQREKEKEKEEKTLGASAPSEPAAPDPFDDFWQAYPRREGPNPKTPARQRFERLVANGVDPAMLVAAAKALGRDHHKPTRYVPQAVTWLNQERFKDMPKPAEPPAAKPIDWQKFLDNARMRRQWFEELGPMPNEPDTRVPAELVKPGDGEGWYVQRSVA